MAAFSLVGLTVPRKALVRRSQFVSERFFELPEFLFMFSSSVGQCGLC